MLEVKETKINFEDIFSNYIKNYKPHTYSWGDFDFGSGYDDDDGSMAWWHDYLSSRSEESTSIKISRGRKGRKKKNDYFDDDCFYNNGIPEKKNRSRGGKRTKNKKKYKEEDIDNNLGKKFESIEDYAIHNENKSIYFYSDVLDKKTKQEFKSLLELDAFLGNDVEVPETTVLYMLQNDVLHCTIVETEEKIKHLIVDNSYGALVWTVQSSVDETTGLSNDFIYS